MCSKSSTVALYVCYWRWCLASNEITRDTFVDALVSYERRHGHTHPLDNKLTF